MTPSAYQGNQQDENAQSDIEPACALSSQQTHPEVCLGVFEEPLSVTPRMPEAEDSQQTGKTHGQQHVSKTVHGGYFFFALDLAAPFFVSPDFAEAAGGSVAAGAGGAGVAGAVVLGGLAGGAPRGGIVAVGAGVGVPGTAGGVAAGMPAGVAASAAGGVTGGGSGFLNGSSQV